MSGLESLLFYLDSKYFGLEKKSDANQTQSLFLPQ